MDYDRIYAHLESVLDAKRLRHVLGTEKTAVELAKRWNADEDKARTAALLHDITKQLNRNQQLKLCEEYGIVLDDVELGENKLLHAITGAELAAAQFGVDSDVYDAIRWHTTGRAGMSLLEKVIYLADYVEPGRDFEGVAELRREVFTDIDSAMVLGLGMSVCELVQSGKMIHICTVEARNCLISAKNSDNNAIESEIL